MAIKITVKLPIDVTKAERILRGFCGDHGYQENFVDGEGKQTPNSETRQAFLVRKLAEYVGNSVASYERRVAEETAGKAAQESVISLLKEPD